jgi:tetratricopeptide (TPR) repeat protein
LETGKDSTEISAINDTVTWIYEEKMKLEKDPAWELDYAMMLVTQKSKDNGKIDGLFTNIHTLKENASGGHIRTYFRHLIVNKFNSAPAEEKEGERANVIEEYIVLSDYCADALKVSEAIVDTAQKDRALKSYQSAQDFLDKYFLKIANDCDALTPVLDKKFESLPEDVEERKVVLNKYMNLLDKQKCTDSETYEKYVKAIVELDPTASGYYGLGNVLSNKGDEKGAIEAFQKATELEGAGENGSAYTLALASAQYSANQYKAAFSTANKVTGDLKGKAMIICGNSIAATANGCGDSTFERKANYWLANDYYGRAASLGENASASKFLSNAPNQDDMFQEGVSVGASVNLSCWGESTTAR